MKKRETPFERIYPHEEKDLILIEIGNVQI
jgi:hypothetical protein